MSTLLSGMEAFSRDKIVAHKLERDFSLKRAKKIACLL